MLPARRKAQISGLTRDFAFYVVERPDPVQSLTGDLGFGCRPDVMKVAAQMRPTGCFTEPGSPVGFGVVKLGIALVTISLEDASGSLEMLVDVFFQIGRASCRERV